MCGNCCKLLVIDGKDYNEEGKHLLTLKRSFIRHIPEYDLFVMLSPCKHLSRLNKCEIYQDRPKICKKSPESLNWDTWHKICPECKLK